MPEIDNRFPVNIEDEMKRSYMDYAMSVIIGRALPDVRDGLKPAHRRVLFGMRTMGAGGRTAELEFYRLVSGPMVAYRPALGWVVHGSAGPFRESGLTSEGATQSRCVWR